MSYRPEPDVGEQRECVEVDGTCPRHTANNPDCTVYAPEPDADEREADPVHWYGGCPERDAWHTEAQRHTEVTCSVCRAHLAAAKELERAADEIRRTFADPDRRRPRVAGAEFGTDLANDSEWAEQIVRARAARLREQGGE